MSDEWIFTPAKSPNLREVVYERIKEAIVCGQIPAGSRLSEIELSKQFDVSRTPVREAIRQLAETGLVRLSARRGAYVLLPTAEDLCDLYEIRNALELITVEHLCQETPREELLAARALFSEVSNELDAGSFMEMDEAFHAELTRLGGNHFLNSMYAQVSAIIQVCRRYAIGYIPKVRSSQEHILVIESILAGDGESAKAYMSAHLNSTRDALLQYIKEHPEAASYPQDANGYDSSEKRFQ